MKIIQQGLNRILLFNRISLPFDFGYWLAIAMPMLFLFYSSQLNGQSINSPTISQGSTATLNFTGCSGSNFVSWSNGKVGTSINVSPLTTTSYSANCYSSVGANLKTNPGFESDFTDWDQWGNTSTVSITTAAGEFRSGAKAAKINGTSTGVGMATSWPGPTVTPGTTYSFSAWGKCNNLNGWAGISLAWNNSSGTEISRVQAGFTSTTTFEQVAAIGTAPAGAAYAYIQFWSNTGTILYVDDIVFQTVNAPTSATGTVTVTAAPKVLVNSNSPVLPSTTINLSATGGGTYAWAGPNGFTSTAQNPTISNASASHVGMYTVTVTNGASSIVGRTWVSLSTSCSSVCDFDTLNRYNLIAFSGANLNGADIEGRSVFGGNTSMQNHEQGSGIAANSGFATIVYGNLLSSGGIIKGNLAVSGTWSQTPAGSTAMGSYTSATGVGSLPFNFANAHSLLHCKSNTWGLFPATGTVSKTVKDITLDGANATGTVVFTLTAGTHTDLSTDFTIIDNYFFTNCNNASSILINIIGTDVGFGNNAFLNYPSANKIIVNCYQANMVSLFGTALIGTLLAPDADASINYGHIEGHVFVNYLSTQNGGEAHYKSFIKQIGSSCTSSTSDRRGICNIAPTCSGTIEHMLRLTNFVTNGSAGTEYRVLSGEFIESPNNTAYFYGRVQNVQNPAVLFDVQFNFIGKTSTGGSANPWNPNGCPPFTTAGWTYYTGMGGSMDGVIGTPLEGVVVVFSKTNPNQYVQLGVGASGWNASLMGIGGTFNGTVLYDNGKPVQSFTTGVLNTSIGCSEVIPFTCTTCPSGNQVVNPDFETNVSSWIASNGQVSQGTAGQYGNFIQVNVSDLAGTYTAYQDITIGSEKDYQFTGFVAKHSTTNNAKMYLEFYNGTTLISKTNDFNVTLNYNGTTFQSFSFEGKTPTNTTKARMVGWCNGTSIKFDKLSFITCGANSITLTATNNGPLCVGSTLNLTSTASSLPASSTQLVVNGNFSTASVTGFSTDVPSGSYGFTTNPNSNAGDWLSIGDHTTGTGNMMWFSDDNTASNRRQWYQTYTVTTNTVYTMSVWVRRVINWGSANPIFYWSVNGTQVGSTVTATTAAGWVQLTTTWNSGSNTSATFAVVQQTNNIYHDFVIDDVSITYPSTLPSYQWSGPNGFTSTAQNPSITNVTGAMAGSYNVTVTAAGCSGNATTNVVLSSAANGGTTSPANQTICASQGYIPTAITLSGHTGTIARWEYMWPGGSWTDWGGGGSTTAPNNCCFNTIGTWKVRAIIQNAGCTAVPSSESNIIVVADPSISTTGGTSVCSGGNATLTAAPSGGTGTCTIQWQISTDNIAFTNIASANAATFNTGALSATRYYRAIYSCTGMNCDAGTSNVQTVTVNPSPAVPTVVSASRCGTGTVTLTGTPPSGSTLYWYDASNATQLGSGNSYTTPSLSTTTTYNAWALNTATNCWSATGTAVVATINTIPTATAGSNSPLCVGSTLNLTSSGGTSYLWSGPNSFTSTSQNTTISNVTTAMAGTYSVTVTNAGCTATATTVVAISLAAAGGTTSPATQTICASQGNIPTAITLSGHLGTIVRWEYATPGGGWNDWAGGGSTTAPGTCCFWSVGTWKVRAIIQSGTCTATPSSEANIIVVADPSISTTGGLSVCSGGNATLTATPSGGTGTCTIQWQISTDNITFTNIASANAATFNTGALSATRYYRAIYSCTGTNCDAGTSNVQTVTVNPLPAAPIATGASRCGTGAVTLVAGGCTGGTLNWYAAASGGVSLGTGTNFTTPAISINTTYYVECTAPSGCISSRMAVTATIINCGSALRTCIVTDGYDTWAGYPTFPLAWAMSGVGETYVLDGTPSFTAYTNGNVMISGSLKGNAVPVVNPSGTDANKKYNFNILLSQQKNWTTWSAGGGTPFYPAAQSPPYTTWNYYVLSSGSMVGTGLNVGKDLSLSHFPSDFSKGFQEGLGANFHEPSFGMGGWTTFTRTDGVSNIGDFIFRSACVCPGFTASISGTNSICNGASTTLTAAATSPLSYLWSTGATTAAVTVNPTTTTTYTVTVTNTSNCTATSSQTVTVNPLPAAPTATSASRCGTGTVVLTGTPPSGSTLYWYDASNATQLGSGNSYTTPSLSTTTTYYAWSLSAANCWSATGTAVVATINAIPTATAGSNSPLCVGATLNLTSSGGTSYSWSGPNSFTSTTQNPTISNVTTGMGGSYFVTVTNASSCTAVATTNVIINSLPADVTITNASRCGTGVVTLSATPPANTTVYWYDSVGGTLLGSGNTFTTPSLSTTTTYRVWSRNAALCWSPLGATATATINPIPTATAGSNSPLCAGATLNLTSSGGTSYSWSGPNSFTSTTQNPTISNVTTIMAGVYSVTVTNAGCAATATTTVVISATPIGGTTSPSTQTICASQGNIPTAITLSGHSGTIVRWEYATPGGGWNDWAGGGSTTAPGTCCFTSVGTWKVRAIIQSGTCTTVPSSESNIVVVADPSISTTGGTSVCSGGNATLTATPSGGTGTCTIQWQISTDNVTFTNIASANAATFNTGALSATRYYRAIYSCTGMNCDAGISNVQTVTVNPLPVTPTATGASRCGAGTVVLTGTPPSGSTLYWYDATNATQLGSGNSYTTPSLSTTTTYYAWSLSAANCWSATGTAVVATINAIPTATAGSNSPLCVGATLNLTSSGGTSYSWSGPNSFTSTTQNPAIGNVTTGMGGSYSVTVTNANNCTAVATTNVIINSLPADVTITNASRCGTGVVTLSATPPANTTVYWYDSVGGTLLGSGNTFTTPSLSTTTTYRVWSRNAALCWSPLGVTATATINTIPTATISGTTTICNGASTTLTASGGTSYLWSNAAVTAAITVNPSTTTTYTVTITNASGCTDVESATVTVNALPAATASGSTVCANGTITLTSGGGTSYSWSGPSTFTSTLQNPTRATATAAMAGTYTVTVTNAASCSVVATATVVVNINPTVTLTSTAAAVCVGYGATITATPSGGTSYTYLWSNAATTAAITVTPAVTTTYTVTITNQNGCSITGTYTLIVNTRPAAPTATGASRCGTGTLILTGTAPVGTTLFWYDSAGSVLLGSGSPWTTPSISTNTTYTAWAQDANNCWNSVGTPAIATINPAVAVNITGTNIICNGATTTLTANASGGSGFTYLWSNAVTTAAISISPTITTTYTVTATNSTGCTAVVSQVVTVNVLPTATVTGSAVCIGGTLTATATGGGTYTWSGPGGFTATTATISRPAATTAMNGLYFVTVTNASSCTAVVTASLATRLSNAVPTLTNNGPVCSGQAINLTVAGLAPSGQAASFNGTNQYINVVQDIPESNFTIETWVKTGATNGGIFGVMSGVLGSGGSDRHIAFTNGNLYFRIWNGNGWYTGVTINDNQWHHIALVAETGVGQRVYVDGIPVVTTNSYDHSDFNWQTDFSIGYSSDAGYLNGQIDNTRIWNVARTSQQIMDNMRLNAPVSTTGLVSNYLYNGNANAAIGVNGTTPNGVSYVVPNEYNYTWIGTNAPAAGFNETVTTTGASSGSYSVSYTANTCASIATNTTPTINPLPTATATGDTECIGGTISLTANGGTSYVWSGPNSFTSNAQNPTIASATAAMAGTYTVTVTNGNSCTAATSAVVVINTLPADVTITNASRCGTGVVTLSATPPANTTVYWYDSVGGTLLGSGNTFTTASLSTTTTYRVWSRNAALCWSPLGVTATATINTIPTATISGTTTICNGASTTLTASGGTSYLWSNAAATAAITVNPSTTTTYTVTVTNVSSCTAVASQTITTIAAPYAGTGSSVSMCKTEISATTNLFAMLTGEQASGSWTTTTFPSGMTAAAVNTKITSGVLEAKGLPAGTYIIQYTVTGTSPCPNDTENVTITINPCCVPAICMPMATRRQ